MRNWRREAQIEALPMWLSDVPFCDEQCPHHDGKRCRLLGFRPDRVCEPVVRRMAEMLAEATSGEP